MAKTIQDYQKVISQLPRDLTGLTESQINDAIEAYTALQSQPSTTTSGDDLKQYFVRQLRSKIRSAISGAPISDNAVNDISNYAVNALNQGNYNPQEVVNRIVADVGPGREGGTGWQGRDEAQNISTAKLIANDIPIDYTREVQSGKYQDQTIAPPDYNQQIGELQRFLTPLQEKNKKEKAVSDYIAGLPAENDQRISDFEKTLQNSQSEFFGGTLASQIIQAMNARGLVNSGDLTDSLTSASAGLQRDIKNTVAPIRLNASQDVANKKYENILRGALEQGQSLTSAIDFARNLYSQDLQNQFTASQSDLTRKFQSDQFSQQMALQMALSRASSNSGPNGLDMFLQYGLPVLSQGANPFIAEYAKQVFKPKSNYNSTGRTY